MPSTCRPTSQPSPVRSLVNKLSMCRNISGPPLPRKLASSPFAASLLSPLSLGEVSQRRLQLQRLVDIVVLDATRDKKSQLVITLKLSLMAKAPRDHVPNTVHEIAMMFQDVNQLSRLLVFCVDRSTRSCDDNCAFCSDLRTYLGTHWVRDPMVTVVTMGDTVLRKPSLAMHLAQLVAFATGKSLAIPRVASIAKEKGVAVVQLVPHLSPLGQNKEAKNAAPCAAQDAVAAVLYDFFDVFAPN